LSRTPWPVRVWKMHCAHLYLNACGGWAKRERPIIILEAVSAAGARVEKVNLAKKFEKIPEYWKPYIAAELNGQHVKLDRLKGEFVWHRHEKEDEMFWVVKGRFRMDLREDPIWLEEGEFLVVPRGVEHRPVADEEAWVVLFEPASTVNTGNVESARTLRKLDHI